MVSIRTLTTILTYAISLCGVIPLFPWLTTAPRIFLTLGILSGIWQDRRGVWPMKPWMQNSAIVPVFIYYALQYSRHNPIQPVVSVLAIMLAVRLSGEKTVRHNLQIHALSLFCLASSSLFDLSPMFLVYLGSILFFVAIALVLMTFLNQNILIRLSMTDLRKVLAAGVLMPILSLPLILFFFPLLPRTQLPLWSYLSSNAGLTSGLSDKVEPGTFSSMAESHALVFRAEMPRQQQQQYWRGTVFNKIEGNSWVRDRVVPFEKAVINRQTISQAIYPEPTNSKVLIALDRPSSISLRWLKGAPDGVFEYFGSTRRRLNYNAISVGGSTSTSGSIIDNEFYLRLPADIPGRILRLAADIRRKGKDDRARLELLETHFRNGGYRYSTRDLPTGDKALDRFLFETKQGHCEFFASSFALLLRSAGVPSRLVGGYLGGDYNELGGYYLVTEKMAHVWVEVFIEGSGWIRIDPSTFAENAGNIFRAEKSTNPMIRLRLLIDSLNHSWNRTVIPYDFERQIDFVNYAGKQLHGIDATKSIRPLVPYIFFIALLLGLTFVARRKFLFRSREERILRSFLLRVNQDFGFDGVQRRMGLFEIAEESGNEKMMEFVNIYTGAVYRDRKLTDEEYLALRQILH
jgi:transglutaminase-like putative cysteine protease